VTAEPPCDGGVARRLEFDGLSASTAIGTCSRVTVRRRESEDDLTRPTGLGAEVDAEMMTGEEASFRTARSW